MNSQVPVNLDEAKAMRYTGLMPFIHRGSVLRPRAPMEMVAVIVSGKLILSCETEARAQEILNCLVPTQPEQTPQPAPVAFAAPEPAAPRPAERPANTDLHTINTLSKANQMRRVRGLMQVKNLPEQPKWRRVEAVGTYFNWELDSFADLSAEQLRMLGDALAADVWTGAWQRAKELQEAVA